MPYTVPTYTVPTSNSGSTYFNTNQCFSFNNHLPDANMVCLSSQPCSEVIIWNDTGQDVYIYAGPDDASGDFAKYSDQARALLLPKLSDQEISSITVRGLTNSNQVSAKKAAAGSAGEIIYYRTQFFSNNPSR